MPELKIGRISIGKRPCVVGTVSTPRALLSLCPRSLPCDIVEARLDRIGLNDGWLEACRRIQAAGKPVIATIRLQAEGGSWSAPDRARENAFQAALEHLAAVDVEYRSPLRRRLAALAARHGKAVIISYHDFQGTPPLSKLKRIVRTIFRYDSAVAKIATMTRNWEDVRILLRLLVEEEWPGPICILGMGPAAELTRTLFPCLGSALSYGYLDQPLAPGQMSCRRLSALLEKALAFRQSAL